MVVGVLARENRYIENSSVAPSSIRDSSGASCQTGSGRRGRAALQRSRESSLLGGVCGGLGERLGVDPTVLRIVAVPLALLAGGGVLVYMAAWILLPRDGEQSIAKTEISDRREVRIILGVATAVVGLLLGLQAFGLQDMGTVAWPLLLCAVGLFVVWRGCTDDERSYLRGVLEKTPILGVRAPKSPRNTLIRVLAGLVLIAVGLGGFASISHPAGAAERAFLGSLAVFAGFLVIFGSWWLRVLQELAEERRERVRSQERANMAAHIHDSVLQTLTLIQKSSSNPLEVTRLARAQERELRSWLFEGVTPGTFDGNPSTLAFAIASIEGEVEDGYGIGIETVVVGDCPLDDPLRALLAAGREATVNAAKWSGASSVSLFAEVGLDSVSMFIRDRGRGFDPEAVPLDRNGISQSIRERVARHGGYATIRSEFGSGTEVELTMPRKTRTD